MSTSSLRGGLIGLALAVGSGAGSYLAVSQAQQEQDARLEQVASELSLLRKAVMSRPPAPMPGGERAMAVGMPPAVKSGEVKLGAEELDALAARMVIQLQQSGAFDSAQPQQPPPPPAALNPQQQEAVARANGLVDRVLSMGRMTPEDVQEIRRELATVKGRTEADEVRRRIIVAINRSQLTPPDGPEPLP